MKIKHGIIAYVPSASDEEIIDILHFCGYENPPTDADFHSLTEELNTDQEFGLVGRVGADVFLMAAPGEFIRGIINELGTDEV